MASSRGSSTPFSRPYPPVIVKKRPSPASVTPVIATATSTAAGGSSRFSRAASPTMSSTAKVLPTRTVMRQQSRVGLSGGANASRKRARRDSDENSEGQDASILRPPRARQRLSSTSSMMSVKTLKTASSVETLRGAPAMETPTPRATEFARPLSRQSSVMKLKRENSSMTNLANAMGRIEMPENSARARALRRVSNLNSSSTSIRDVKIARDEAPPAPLKPVTPEDDLLPYPSRIPLPTSRSSSMLSRARNLISRRPSLSSIRTRPVRSLTPPPPFSLDTKPEKVELVINDHASTSSADSVGDEPEDRYILTVAVRDKHLELWDQDDSHVHAWAAFVSVTDRLRDSSHFPIEDLDIRLSTHSYEGHEAPLYTTSHIGNTVRRGKELEALKEEFDSSLGIVSGSEWQVNPQRAGQWFLKIWAPVPLALFRDRDTRMFKLEASASVVDDRTWGRGVVQSRAVFDDVSHLRKENVMDNKRRGRLTI
ncbi:unnamed protein product [Peniophora sp. CBMAI 1063]|nr:unnamed protein product [Peniophora sp. CBMAI 1063]